MIKKRFCTLLIAGIMSILIAILACTTKDPVKPSGSSTTHTLDLSLSSASWDETKEMVTLVWTAPASPSLPVIGYRIYREVDTTTEMSFEKPVREILNPAIMQVDDPPGVVNGIYYYKIAAIGININDTIVGQKSAAETVDVKGIGGGRGVIRINDGALYAITPSCSISLTPDTMYTNFSVANSLAGLATAVASAVPVSVLSSRETILRRGYLLATGGGVKEVFVNAQRTISGNWDTLTTFIRIQPADAKISIRNSELIRRRPEKPERTMADGDIDFEIRTFGDTTFSQNFQLWVVSGGKGSPIVEEKPKSLAPWFETTPIDYSLGFDASGKRNEDYIYGYNIDSDSRTYDSLRYTLSSIDETQRRAGAYWGGDTTYYNGATISNKDSIFYLTQAKMKGNGVKEFFLIGRFTGKHFNEERYYFSNTIQSTRAYWDRYPPMVTFRTGKNDTTPPDGDTITTAFDVRLSSGTSILDQGGANPSEVSLYIAKIPDDTVDAIKGNTSTFPRVALSSILNYRHKKYDFSFTTSTYYVANINWYDIDPVREGWVSGNYLLAVVAKDGLGNEGIAVCDEKNEPNKINPRIINIQTGR